FLSLCTPARHSDIYHHLSKLRRSQSPILLSLLNIGTRCRASGDGWLPFSKSNSEAYTISLCGICATCSWLRTEVDLSKWCGRGPGHCTLLSGIGRCGDGARRHFGFDQRSKYLGGTNHSGVACRQHSIRVAR